MYNSSRLGKTRISESELVTAPGAHTTRRGSVLSAVPCSLLAAGTQSSPETATSTRTATCVCWPVSYYYLSSFLLLSCHSLLYYGVCCCRACRHRCYRARCPCHLPVRSVLAYITFISLDMQGPSCLWPRSARGTYGLLVLLFFYLHRLAFFALIAGALGSARCAAAWHRPLLTV